MIVEQIWTANAGRNFNYLIACPETGEALAVDPLDHQKCLAAAKAKGWTITQILNTHEHRDHTDYVERQRISQLVLDGTGAQPREVRLLHVADRLIVFVSVAVPADMTLPQAHDLASRLEDDIRDGRPHMHDVVVHTEPSAGNSCAQTFRRTSRATL